jgi:catechol 2,3-dioxygenase-like lactoylglutathione lyase family enzyme
MKVRGVLESCLYATDLAAAERFYTSVLGLEVLSHVADRHIFFRCGQGVLLIFNPERTRAEQTAVGGSLVPLHGTEGAGHLAFAVAEAELDAWRERLLGLDVQIESEVSWPRGGRSLYFRDPAGNSIELAQPGIWALSEQ